MAFRCIHNGSVIARKFALAGPSHQRGAPISPTLGTRGAAHMGASLALTTAFALGFAWHFSERDCETHLEIFSR
jgi:hypothetical protein